MSLLSMLGSFVLGGLLGTGVHFGASYYVSKKNNKPIFRHYRSPLFFTSLICAIACLISYCRFGLSAELFETYACLIVLTFISMCDLALFTIPNASIACLLLIRLVYYGYIFSTGNFSFANLASYLLAFIVCAAVVVVCTIISQKFSKAASIGGGDIKLFATGGFYFGIEVGLLLIFLSCIFALIVNLVFKKEPSQSFPFGPEISIVFFILLMI